MTEVAIDKDQIVANATYIDVPDTDWPMRTILILCSYSCAMMAGFPVEPVTHQTRKSSSDNPTLPGSVLTGAIVFSHTRRHGFIHRNPFSHWSQ